MAFVFAVLRILIPLALFLLLLGVILPRLRKHRARQSSRIEVDATVVSSKQHEASGVGDAGGGGGTVPGAPLEIDVTVVDTTSCEPPEPTYTKE